MSGCKAERGKAIARSKTAKKFGVVPKQVHFIPEDFDPMAALANPPNPGDSGAMQEQQACLELHRAMGIYD